MKQPYCWLAIAAGLMCGCGAGRQEAVGFGRILQAGKGDFTAANTTEKELVAATRGWVDSVTTQGSGRGEQLTQNAKIAGDLAKSADNVSTQLGQLRKAVYDQQLQKEFLQGIRSTLITQITQRQRALQELRATLHDCEAELTQLSQTRNYRGDSYPQSVAKLSQVLGSFATPADLVGDALKSLKDEYGLKDADLAAQTAAK